MPHPSHWQDTLNPPFVQRLLRPWLHPGRIDPRMSNAIFTRYQPLTPLPLVDQLTQRQNRIATSQSSSHPIVYAQPSSPAPITSQASAPSIARPQPTGSPTVIQAKFVSSNSAATLLSARQPSTAQPDRPPTKQPPSIQAPIQAQSGSAPTSKRPLASPIDSLISNPVERSPLPVTPNLPDLSLIQPANPAATAASPPLRRPRRPRFERDIGRLTANSSADLNANLGVPSGPTIPSPPLPDPTPLPLASTAAPDSALPLTAQSLYPIVAATRSITEQETIDRNSPLVSVRLSQSHETVNRPELPVVVRSSHPIEKAIASTEAAITTRGRSQEQPVSSPLPLVQVSNSVGMTGQPVTSPRAAQPLVFAASAGSPTGGVSTNNPLTNARNSMSFSPADRSHPAADFGRSTAPAQPVPIVSAQRQIPQPPPVDVEALADKVERKLMRRLVIERERRGWRS